jgi:3D (Asp-Asp-Asp) domain-containing protein
MTTLGKLLMVLGIGLFAGCASEDDGATGTGGQDMVVSRSFVAKGTGYFPAPTKMEGGSLDLKGARLRTLQEFIAGQAEYVSVAMDTSAFKYGTRLRIAEVNAKYGKEVIFRVVDTGGAFKGKGTTRIDICTANQKASVDPTINATLHLDVVDESSPPPAAPPASADPAPPADPTPAPSASAAPGDPPEEQGASCRSDSACNPGNDGSGLICVDSRCVPGCHTNAQCPGSTKCSSGTCS